MTLVETKPAPPREITRKDFVAYLRALDRARQAERESRNSRKTAELLEAEIKAWIDANKTGKIRSIDKSGYRAAIEEKQANPSWKDEFIKKCGEAEALRVSQEDRPVDKLVVTPLTAKAAEDAKWTKPPEIEATPRRKPAA